MFQLGLQAIVAARPQPAPRVGTEALRAQVQLDGQFQVMHPIAITQHHIQLAQGPAVFADSQVGRQQFDAGRLLQGKLPQAFVIQPEAAAAKALEPVLQGRVIGVQPVQPGL